MLVQIDYNLNFTTPFHMGTGISTNALDRTVVRDSVKDLYIPASTFKGVLREQCEHLLRFYAPNLAKSLASPHDAETVLSEFGRRPGLISRIFGSHLYPGNLRFDDIKQINKVGDYRELQTSILTQVRIDRLTGTAVDKALYSSEFGNTFLTFAGTIKGQLECISIEDLELLSEDKNGIYILTPTYSLLLLLAGILMIERIGSNKSTGKGECNCIITRVLLDRRKCSEVGMGDENGWRYWIENLDKLSNYQEEERGERE